VARPVGRALKDDDKKRGDVLRCEERNVRAKDMLFVLDCRGGVTASQ
jgi:hypothetical protein